MTLAEAEATLRHRDRRRVLIVVASIAAVALTTGTGLLWWSAPRADVPLPSAQASPEEVVLAYTRAVQERDFDTANAIDARPGDLGRFDRPSTFVDLEHISTQGGRERAYVSFSADVLHHDNSMEDQMVWGFFLERGTDGRWQIVDAGVG